MQHHNAIKLKKTTASNSKIQEVYSVKHDKNMSILLLLKNKHKESAAA